jgi:hypothetical protein
MRVDNLGSDASPVRELTDKEIKDAQLTMIELGKYCEGDVSKQEMRNLIEMITPVNKVTVTGISRLGAS